MWSNSRATSCFILAQKPLPEASDPAPEARRIHPAAAEGHAARRGRFVLARLFAALALIAVLLTLGMAPVGALAQSSVRPPGNAVTFPDAPEPTSPNTLGDRSVSDFWRDFRGGVPRDPAVILGAKPPGTEMTTTGQQWRELRVRYIRPYAGWVLLGVLAFLVPVYLVLGRARIKGGRSGRTVQRFDLIQRVGHWFMAFVFLFLGLSGLMILLGRPLIEPVLGKAANSVLATAAMQGHNLFGPIFILALLWMLVKFVRGNFFHWVDFVWMFKLGGLFGGRVSAGRYNFGEKTLFWLVILIGLVMSVTGLAMLFPWLFEDLRWLQLSTVLHVVGAITLISAVIGHIYIGTIGIEGAIEGMVTGNVDENFAREHHDLWFEQLRRDEAAQTGGPEGIAADAAAATGKTTGKTAGKTAAKAAPKAGKTDKESEAGK